MFAGVKTRRRLWHNVGERAAEPSWSGRSLNTGERCDDRPTLSRERWRAAVQLRRSGWVMRTNRIRLRGGD